MTAFDTPLASYSSSKPLAILGIAVGIAAHQIHKLSV
jgi:hypothetical protein